ncbi:MAG: ABC transporter ATP-binding protein, partial [Spirochaetes bacterium]|nr:ABC transporter ATP-binding protein [Spirochaetota bacterium]
LQKRIGVTIVYVTHDQSEAMVMSKRIVVMGDGKIHQIGTPHEIYKSPADQFVGSFIGKSNFIVCDVIDVKNNVLAVRIGGKHVIKVTGGGDLKKKQVTLMVRHHNVEILKEKKPDAVQAKVRLATYLGDRFIYEVEIGNINVMADTPEGHYYKEGKEVFIRLKNPVIF